MHVSMSGGLEPFNADHSMRSIECRATWPKFESGKTYSNMLQDRVSPTSSAKQPAPSNLHDTASGINTSWYIYLVHYSNLVLALFNMHSTAPNTFCNNNFDSYVPSYSTYESRHYIGIYCSGETQMNTVLWHTTGFHDHNTLRQ